MNAMMRFCRKGERAMIVAALNIPIANSPPNNLALIPPKNKIPNAMSDTTTRAPISGSAINRPPTNATAIPIGNMPLTKE